eukprot:242984_1
MGNISSKSKLSSGDPLINVTYNPSKPHATNAIPSVKITYKERINNILMVNDKMDKLNNNDNNDQNEDIYDIIHKIYCKHDGINGFFVDYVEFIKNMDEDKIYIYNDDEKQCDFESCKSLERNY